LSSVKGILVYCDICLSLGVHNLGKAGKLLQDDWRYYFHSAVNFLVTVSIFALIYLIAEKVLVNMGSLLNIVTI